jgi:lysyl-tRNA synthetase, class I
LLLYKRVSGTRHVSIEDVPNLMDEYDFFEDMYFGTVTEDNTAKRTKIMGIYEYIHHLQPPKAPSTHIPYRILAQQALLFRDQRNLVEKVYDRLVKYGLVKEKPDSLIKKIQMASNWASVYLSSGFEKIDLNLSQTQQDAILELTHYLKSLNASNPDELSKTIQSEIFSIARKRGVQPKEFFTILYRILINTDKGPRLGNYIVDLGIDRTSKQLDNFCGNVQHELPSDYHES